MTPARSRLAEEFHIIPQGWNIAALLSFVGTELLMEKWVPRWAHHPRDLPPEPWWGLITFASAVLMAAMILLIGYIYADAKRRGMNAVLWVILIILIPKPIGFIAYFLLRKPLLKECPQCSEPLRPDFAFCPKCHYSVGVSCAHCGRPIGTGFVFCPYCGHGVGTTPAPAA